MKCDELQSMLLDYIDCQTDWIMSEAIMKHMESCPKCNEQYIDWQEIINEIQNAKQVVYDLPEFSVKEKVLNYIEIFEKQKSTFNKNIKIWNYLASTAAAFAIFFIGFAGYTDISKPPIVDNYNISVVMQEDYDVQTKKEDVVRIASNEGIVVYKEGTFNNSNTVPYALGGIFAGIGLISLGFKRSLKKQLNEILK